MSRPPERTVRATAPARLDFAGGWSDTPPICFDRGGTVVNAAVKLGGECPIEATARLTEDPVITLIGREAGQRVVLDSLEQLRDSRDPGRWDALPRACLWLGLRATEPEGDLRSRLRSLGGGIELTVSSVLPQGSGLGASSILGAAIFACLVRLTRQMATREDLVARTLAMEQWLTTGGGWQDQVGGIYP